MKKFILRVIQFTSILITIILLLFVPIYIISPEIKRNDFYGKDSDKTKKIVLVGSSNIYVNYDYINLNEAFEEYDVIGSHYSLVTGFMPLITQLKLLKLQEDDIIVFCLPYELYDEENFIHFFNKGGQKVMSKKLVRDGLSNNFFQILYSFSKFDPKGYMDFFKNVNIDNTKNNDSIIFYETQVNLLKEKDYTGCHASEDGYFHVNSIGFDKKYLKTFFSNIQKDIKSKIYFRFPPLRKDYFEINEEKIEFMIKSGRFINDFEASIYESNFWYDHRYHLNKCGAEKNTDLIILELKGALNLN